MRKKCEASAEMRVVAKVVKTSRGGCKALVHRMIGVPGSVHLTVRGPGGPTTVEQARSVHNCSYTSRTMARPYTSGLLTMWCSLFLILPILVSSHMIEVPASKKECFFEDLHINDKVRVTYCSHVIGVQLNFHR